MPVEIFLSSSDESSRGEPIIVSDTSEEDAPSPPLANPAPPPFPRLASRKIAFGASTHPHPQKKKRKLLKSQVPVSPKQERVVTSRRIVKVKREDAEEDGLGGQRLPRRRLTGKYRDPLLEEISLPFSLSLRLEEIRLNLQNAPARPVIRTALAFRHVTQSAKTALRGPSATVSIPLRPPSSGTSMTSTAIPSPLSLRVVRNPAIPIKTPDPASLDYRPPDNLGELAEVLLLLSIRDAALPSTGEPYYTVTLPISKDRRFQLSGERTTKRAADGTQVTVSWKAELEREGYGYAEPTEEEIEVFVEREMKVVEQEWRREVAERALVRTSRDFEVLRRLLHFLQVDLEEVAELEAEAVRDGAADPHHFAFERSLSPDHVLIKALDVYQRRTGRTACTVQRDHRLISDEELVPQPDPLDICYLCGAFGCILHANLIAYNRPTKPAKDVHVQQKGGCRDCGYRRCKAHDKAEQTMPTEEDLEKEQKLFDLPPIDACTAALILERPVSDPVLFRPPPPAPIPKPRGRPWEHMKLIPIDSEGYVPCDCRDKCGDNCGCAGQATFCDRFCNCPPSCPRRYGGCRDHLCSKAEKCWCRDLSRECHPEVCGCPSSCSNSKIRLHHQKATTVARSQIERGGYGLVLLEPASQGDFIGLYGGELFPQGMTDEVEPQSIESRWGTWKGYWFDVDKSDAIDSAVLGSGMRFINHDPKRANVVPQEIVHERAHPRHRKYRTEEERKQAEAERQKQVAQRISSLVAQLLAPLTPLFSLPGLTEHWYVRRDASGFITESKPDPPLIIAAGAVTLTVAILANLSILSRLVDTQPRFFTFSTIFLLSVHCVVNLVALSVFGAEHAKPDGYYLSTAFWLSAASGCVALVSIVALIIDGALTKWYHEGGIGVTNKQRSLIVCFDTFVFLLLIGSVCYRYLITGATYLDTIYFCIQSFLTVGFGDVTLNTTGSQIFSLFLNTVGILNFALLVTFTRATALEAMEEQYKTQERIIASRLRNRGAGSRLFADVLSFITCGLVHSREQQEEEQDAEDERHEEEEHGSDDGKKDEQGDQRRYEDAIIELRKERDREFRSQVVVAFSLFLIFWLVGAAAFAKLEGWSYWIGFYFVYVMATSIGYGDYSPQTQGGRAFFCVWAIGGAGVLTVLFSKKENFSRSNWEHVEKNQDFKEFLYLRSLQAKLAELERLAQRAVGSSQDAQESKPSGSGADQEKRGEEVQNESGSAEGGKSGKEKDVRGQAEERNENTKGKDPEGAESENSWVGT
ncbi:Proteophosphoglycan ppg4 [Rhodotorula toruloides]